MKRYDPVVLRRSFVSLTPALLARSPLEALGEQFAQLTSQHGVAQAVLHLRVGKTVREFAAGAAKPDTVFLLASITKPMTAVAVMKLVDRGEVRLQDPVQRYLPEFAGGDRARVTVRHLLTHTSGLPDMLPENDDLRRRHAPLREFVAGAVKTPLLFKPGTECRYQSMGILLAAEIVERLTKRPLRDFLERELFAPLGMKATSLGLGGRPLAGTAPSQVTADPDWNWNSQYWRDLGSPWGGALAPAGDVAKFLSAFLQPTRILKPESARAMVTNQNAGLNKPYGIGFAVSGLGSGCSPKAFGHGGSTGTACWADPARDAVFVLVTTKPSAESGKPVIQPLSDAASRIA